MRWLLAGTASSDLSGGSSTSERATHLVERRRGLDLCEHDVPLRVDHLEEDEVQVALHEEDHAVEQRECGHEAATLARVAAAETLDVAQVEPLPRERRLDTLRNKK
jgi:hypothetical protein